MVEKDVYTEDECFAFEQESCGWCEFVDGEIRAMAGGTEDHGTIAVNVTATLRNAHPRLVPPPDPAAA
jgi:hypothetical protein